MEEKTYLGYGWEQIVKDICSALDCGIEDAKDCLASEIDRLRDLDEADMIKPRDIMDACRRLGLSEDWESYFWQFI